MKKYILLLLALVSFGTTSAQTKYFTITPYENIEKVHGIAFGLGPLFLDDAFIPKVNGINIELSPLFFLHFLFYQPTLGDIQYKADGIRNGITLATSLTDWTINNGISISILNNGYATNGIAINGFYNYTTFINGISIAWMTNTSKVSNGFCMSLNNTSECHKGFQLGFYNGTNSLNGLSLGLSNKTEKLKGVQIGLFNSTKTIKGIQIGFWNTNAKRSLPFINW